MIDKIELENHEEEWLTKLGLDRLTPKYPKGTPETGEIAAKLMGSLMERKAIPSIRLSYFTEPSYNTGPTSGSNYDVFVGNGHDYESAIRHPHFLNYLQYFIFGARLTLGAKQSMLRVIEDCGGITSGDYERLVKNGRRMLRSSRMYKSDFKEEVYKLLLDCGIEEFIARHIRQSI